MKRVFHNSQCVVVGICFCFLAQIGWADADMEIVREGIVMGTDPDFGRITVSNARAFYMDKNEVNGRLWTKVFEWGRRNGYKFSWHADDVSFNGDEYPVENVTFIDAVLWCNARSEMNMLSPCYTTKNGLVCKVAIDVVEQCSLECNGFRLPTCQEWEFAARAFTLTRFYWGNSCEYGRANFGSGTNFYDVVTNAVEGARCAGVLAGQKTGPMPVASFKPNGFGLYDMAGNVAEWCWSERRVNAQYAVVKGGSWRSDSSEMRPHAEKTVVANDHLLVDVIRDIGFRCVRSAD